MIKAIETHYKGYRFRSRLEARWAVFFDALGIEWQYEPEGYNIDGAYYLPDFYLTDYKLLVEIKPEPQPIEIIHKLEKLAYEHAIILFIGLPNQNSAHIFCTETDDGGGGSFDDEDVWWMSATDSRLPHLVSVYDTREREFYANSDYEVLPLFHNMNDFGKHGWDIEGVDRAIVKSKQARFEHGETP